MGKWARVVFTCEFDEDGNCPVCGGVDGYDCDCPGPTMHDDGYEYKIDKRGVMFARKVGAGGTASIKETK